MTVYNISGTVQNTQLTILGPPLSRWIFGEANLPPVTISTGDSLFATIQFESPIPMPRPNLVSVLRGGDSYPVGNGFSHIIYIGSPIETNGNVSGLSIAIYYDGAPSIEQTFADYPFFINSIPEPATWAMLILGLTILLMKGTPRWTWH